jgi:hypothetical protein
MRSDFDPTVAGIASQPFCLYWTGEDEERVAHAPDFFRQEGGRGAGGD